MRRKERATELYLSVEGSDSIKTVTHWKQKQEYHTHKKNCFHEAHVFKNVIQYNTEAQSPKLSLYHFLHLTSYIHTHTHTRTRITA